MFDVGFSELSVIGLVALIVIGPEQLPRVARTAGHLMGRLRRYVSDVKSDISREIELADIQRLHDEVKDSALSMESNIRQEMAGFESDVHNSIAPPEQHELISMPVAEASASHVVSEQAEVAADAGEPQVDPDQIDMFGEIAPPRAKLDESPEKH